MPWFKRKEEETYNEQMLREAGLDEQPREPVPAPLLDPPVLGMGPRAAEWDVYTTCEAPDVAGDSVGFVALPAGDLIVEEEQGDADLSPFADALEQHVQPPYRAIGRREDGPLWAVAARQLDVRRLPLEAGDELELVVREDERTLTVDGAPSDATLPELAEAGDYVVRGTRLDADLWEIQVDRL